jgi:DNA polymerase III epsilon subunit family exonuclease
MAGEMRGDPDAKKLWRFIYQVENLASLSRSHATLIGIVHELLSQRVGPYRNVLEERHDELADPATLPAAAALAERLIAALRTRSRVVLEPMQGLEIALRGLLFDAGFRLVRYAEEVEQAELDDLRIGPADGGPEGLAYTLFKALQLVQARDLAGTPARYVTFDLETTDLDIGSCGIVDIAAARIERGQVTETFSSRVRPDRPISAGARRAHGYSDADVADAPSFQEVWPRFRAFVGNELLVAHNGQEFDVPVLRRMAAPLGGAEDLVVFDTLPLARSLSGDSAKLEALARRFGVPIARAHHALDDAVALAQVYERLEERRRERSRKAAHASLLSHLALALVLDTRRRDTDEVKLLLEVSRGHALGRYSDCLDVYAAEREKRGAVGPAPDEVIQRLGGARLMERLRSEPDPARRYPVALARIQALVEQEPGESMQVALNRFLERVALSTSRGAETSEHSVNLLTLHSTKGLEFSRVYVVGVEDEQIPGWVPRDEDPDAALQESRRLLYVGMTRAIDRLVLTRVDRRAGKPAGGSRLLEEMGLEVERPAAPEVGSGV